MGKTTKSLTKVWEDQQTTQFKADLYHGQVHQADIHESTVYWYAGKPVLLGLPATNLRISARRMQVPSARMHPQPIRHKGEQTVLASGAVPTASRIRIGSATSFSGSRVVGGQIAKAPCSNEDKGICWQNATNTYACRSFLGDQARRGPEICNWDF